MKNYSRKGPLTLYVCCAAWTASCGARIVYFIIIIIITTTHLFEKLGKRHDKLWQKRPKMF